MNAINFKGQNIVFAEDQPEYNPLPAFADTDGTVLTCWKLSFWERLKILFTGRFYLIVHTFNKPLQPILPLIDNPLQLPKNGK